MSRTVEDLGVNVSRVLAGGDQAHAYEFLPHDISQPRQPHGLVSAINARLAVDNEEKVEAGDADAKISLEFLGTILVEELDLAVPNWVSVFVDRIVQVLAENERAEVVDLTAGILNSEDGVKVWSKMRTTCALGVLDILACGSEQIRVTQEN